MARKLEAHLCPLPLPEAYSLQEKKVGDTLLLIHPGETGEPNALEVFLKTGLLHSPEGSELGEHFLLFIFDVAILFFFFH